MGFSELVNKIGCFCVVCGVCVCVCGVCSIAMSLSICEFELLFCVCVCVCVCTCLYYSHVTLVSMCLSSHTYSHPLFPSANQQRSFQYDRISEFHFTHTHTRIPPTLCSGTSCSYELIFNFSVRGYSN